MVMLYETDFIKQDFIQGTLPGSFKEKNVLLPPSQRTAHKTLMKMIPSSCSVI